MARKITQQMPYAVTRCFLLKTGLNAAAKPCIPSSNKKQHRRLGFTLIEVMITLAIVAILTSIALPSYTSYVQKQKIRSAQTDLAALVLQMENFYQQQLAYPAVTTDTASTQTKFSGWVPAQTTFTYVIQTVSGSTYTLKATGSGNLSSCVLTITDANVRAATSCGFGSSWI